MASQSDAQKATVERVMHEFKHGELEQNGGERVEDPKQAIAIALREAGASNRETPSKNRKTLARTKAKERRGETARDEKEGRRGAKAGVAAEQSKSDLYAEARRRGIKGRSTMSKDKLVQALQA